MTEQTPSAPRRDRGYVPTVLVGLAGAALAAVAGARNWATTQGDAAGIKVEASVTGAESQPLVAALALVALASWGVVLVSRGLARRAVAVVGLVASVGALASVVLGLSAVEQDAVDAAVARGATGETFATSFSAWFYLAGLGALLAAAAFAVAVVRAPRWPAMGNKYDAPSARPAPATDEDMWRALDEGRDPTS
jgi:Tryptophan-associated transmembrane protein (Trp_oprn_chp)